MLRLILASALCLGAAPPLAADTVEPVAVAPNPHPMAAVGVILRDGAGVCTGSLIAPGVVLTAAHCVPGAEPERIRFRTGAYPGVRPVERQAREIVAHPLYTPEVENGLERRTGFDLALVRLTEPVPPDAASPLLPTKEAVAAPRLLIASYRGGEGVRARERTCPVIDATDRMIRMGCDVRGGESGSPVLQRQGDALAVVGVLSARGEDGPQKLAVAAGSTRIGQLQALMGVTDTGP